MLFILHHPKANKKRMFSHYEALDKEMPPGYDKKMTSSMMIAGLLSLHWRNFKFFSLRGL